MKKVLLGLCFVLLVSFSVDAQQKKAKKPKVTFAYDAEIPEELTSYIYVPNYVLIKKFGDKDVKWTGKMLTSALCAVPYGNQTFFVDIEGLDSIGLRSETNKKFTVDLEAEKYYQLINRGNEVILLDLK